MHLEKLVERSKELQTQIEQNEQILETLSTLDGNLEALSLIYKVRYNLLKLDSEWSKVDKAVDKAIDNW